MGRGGTCAREENCQLPGPQACIHQPQRRASPAGACRLPHAAVSRACMCGTTAASAGTSQGSRWRSARRAAGTVHSCRQQGLCWGSALAAQLGRRCADCGRAGAPAQCLMCGMRMWRKMMRTCWCSRDWRWGRGQGQGHGQGQGQRRRVCGWGSRGGGHTSGALLAGTATHPGRCGQAAVVLASIQARFRAAPPRQPPLSHPCMRRPTARTRPGGRGCPWRAGSGWAAGPPSGGRGRREGWMGQGTARAPAGWWQCKPSGTLPALVHGVQHPATRSPPTRSAPSRPHLVRKLAHVAQPGAQAGGAGAAHAGVPVVARLPRLVRRLRRRQGCRAGRWTVRRCMLLCLRPPRLKVTRARPQPTLAAALPTGPRRRYSARSCGAMSSAAPTGASAARPAGE